MTKAVFATKIDPSYDDLPEQRYHFPPTYRRAVEEALGDWIVYYEPRRSSGALSSRGGRQSYFATARVVRIERDSRHADYFYAYVEDFLPFDRPVPFREGEHYYEGGLRRADGGTSKGAFGRSVRPISEGEYNAILRSGFAQLLGDQQQMRPSVPFAFAEEQEIFERPIVESVIRRPFRDAVFSSVVKSAYGNTCAMTGLKIINGGGRSEVQAAHIRPVSQSGTDSVRNGVALCGTIHWMFDRGLLSLDDDYNILLAKGKVSEPVKRLLNPDLRMRLPPQPDLRPNPQWLRYHRDEIFKG
ncbi:MAG TPA: restriction endonuclease [Acetobacteraceae bacterium]|nr:restriction endonuclease [Acetobacteraceae bacterium]